MNPNRYPTRPHRRPAAGVLAVVLALVLGLTAAAIAWSAPHADAGASGDVFYLSLGDSLAQGAQPIGGPGSLTGEVGYNHGYADELFKTARDGHSGTLRLVKLGCGGETTTSLITGGDCRYPAGSSWRPRSSSSTTTPDRSPLSRSTSAPTTSSLAAATRPASFPRSNTTCRSSFRRCAPTPVPMSPSLA